MAGKATRGEPERGAVARAVAFVLLTYTISFSVYGVVIAADRGWVALAAPAELAVLAIFGPAIAAVVLRLWTRERAGLAQLVRDTTR